MRALAVVARNQGFNGIMAGHYVFLGDDTNIRLDKCFYPGAFVRPQTLMALARTVPTSKNNTGEYTQAIRRNKPQVSARNYSPSCRTLRVHFNIRKDVTFRYLVHLLQTSITPYGRRVVAIELPSSRLDDF